MNKQQQKAYDDLVAAFRSCAHAGMFVVVNQDDNSEFMNPITNVGTGQANQTDDQITPTNANMIVLHAADYAYEMDSWQDEQAI